MSAKSKFNDAEFWIVTIILLLTIHIATAESLGRLNFNISIFSTRFTHFLSIIGSAFVVLYTPLYYYLKRRNPRITKNLLKLHIFGNTISCTFVTVHFVARLIRLPIGLGVLLYLFMLLLFLSGYTFRYGILKPLNIFIKNIPHNNRYLHVSLTASFYIVFLFHLLQVTDFQ